MVSISIQRSIWRRHAGSIVKDITIQKECVDQSNVII